MEKIKLPPWIGYYSMDSCNLSRPPNHPKCIIVAFSQKPEPCIRFCRPGGRDNKWNDQKLLVRPDTGSSLYEFPVAYKGNLYCFPKLSDELMIIDFDGSKIDIRPVDVENVPREALVPETVRIKTYLVESDSELFRLKINYVGLTDKLSVRYIDVFRLDMEDLSWTRVESLGDRAFFLDTNGYTTSCSSCFAAEDSESGGMKGNCIYLLEPEDKHLYRFDLEDTSLVITLPLPKRIKNWVQTHWVMPNQRREKKRDTGSIGRKKIEANINVTGGLKQLMPKKKSSRNSSSTNISSDDCYPPPPERYPWLVYTHRSRKQFTQTFYSLSEARCYNRSIPDMNDNQKPEPCIRLCRPGGRDNKWNDKKLLVRPDMGSSLYGYPVACKGNLYCFPRLSDELMIIDFDGSKIDIRPVGVEKATREALVPETIRVKTYLVESDSELFRLKINYIGAN
ncbi:hypothetical protein ACH5RR_024662 [Cinchona calisaya]|uniref:KIB1-4 beta-propeller domain-containing protein n=1 Tax=Cinchona calisaya TaxID=153742 RepID=A0ABD2Z0W6_9GENT